MTDTWQWFLAVVMSLLLTLVGLFTDAMIHMQEHVGGSHESLLMGNVGHAIFGVGLVLAMVFALTGFTVSWRRARQLAAHRHKFAVPAALWLAAGLAGMLTLAVMAMA